MKATLDSPAPLITFLKLNLCVSNFREISKLQFFLEYLHYFCNMKGEKTVLLMCGQLIVQRPDFPFECVCAQGRVEQNNMYYLVGSV